MAAEHLIYLSAFLFCTGLATVIIKRNAIMILLGIELMLNAGNLNLITFNQSKNEGIDGQVFVLFIMIVAVCEAAVGMAIILKAFQYFRSALPDQLSELKERN
jgi:NADH:ubiquinone oxidoreductase subunit K